MIEEMLAYNREFVRSKGYEKFQTSKYPDKKIAILILPQLMHHQTSSPVPGIAVFSGISRRIKIVLVDFSCRIPAVNVSVNAITSRLCRIKSTRVERINFRRLPRSIRTSALPVHRLIAVRIRRKDEIIPVSHPEKVRALKRTLCIHRSIERLAIVPVMQILRFAQTHTASPRRFSFFLRRKNHPPAVFFLIPEHVWIAPVGRQIDRFVRSSGISVHTSRSVLTA